MKKKDAIEHFGSVADLAKTLGITPEAIYQWGDDVPEGRAFQIDVLTKGKLRARSSLRGQETVT